MTGQHQLSRGAFDRLKAEFDDLTTRGRVDIARHIERARELGDLSENGDYQAAKEQQGMMEGRIRHLQALLKDAQIVEAGSDDTISTGSVVTIRYEGDDVDERMLVGSIEERSEDLDVVTPGSPLGAALLGRRAGDVVEYEGPSGRLKVEIVDVE